MTKRSITERHIAALNVLGYAIILSDGRITTGVIGFMLANYSRAFVLFLALWAFCGAIFLLWRRSSALGILIASLPIFAYSVMGLWFVLFGQNAPIAAFILPFLSAMTILWLIHTRLRALARGEHDDDSIPTRPK